MLKNNNEYVVIVPTHNMHENLIYSMEYYNNFGSKIIFVDSSDKKYIYDKKLLNNIEYIHLPGKNFISKLLFCIKEIKAEYICLSPDDDFLINESLNKGLKYLKDNSYIQAYIGELYGFDSLNYKKIKYLYSNQKNVTNRYYTIEKKLNLFFNNYCMILWGLYRKKSLLLALEIIDKSKISNDNFIEFLLGVVLIIEGGIKTVKLPWIVREINQSNNWGLRHKSLISMDKEIELDILSISKTMGKVYKKDYFNIALNTYLKSMKDIKVSKVSRIIKKLKVFCKTTFITKKKFISIDKILDKKFR